MNSKNDICGTIEKQERSLLDDKYLNPLIEHDTQCSNLHTLGAGRLALDVGLPGKVSNKCGQCYHVFVPVFLNVVLLDDLFACPVSHPQ